MNANSSPLRLSLSLLVVCSCFVAVNAKGQSAGKLGFYCIVNGVAGPSNTVVSVDNKPLRPDGFKSGRATGGLGLPIGGHTISATNGTLKPGSVPLQISQEMTPIVLIYVLVGKDQFGRPEDQLHLFPRPNKPRPTNLRFSAIYVGKAPQQEVVVNGHAVVLPTLKEVDLGESPSVLIYQKDHLVGSKTPDGKGNYLAVVYDAADSQIAASFVEDAVVSPR
jgi:hypothetical protein